MYLPTITADIPSAFLLGEIGGPSYDRHLPVRVGAFELTQQAVAALDRGIQRVLRGFFAAEGLLQFIVDHIADQYERSKPQPSRIFGRWLERDLLDRDRGAGIPIVETLRAGQIEGRAGHQCSGATPPEFRAWTGSRRILRPPCIQP